MIDAIKKFFGGNQKTNQNTQQYPATARTTVGTFETDLFVKSENGTTKVRAKCQLAKFNPQHYNSKSGFDSEGYHFKISFTTSPGHVAKDVLDALSLEEVKHEVRSNGDMFIISQKFLPAKTASSYAALVRLAAWVEQFQPVEGEDQNNIVSQSGQQSS